MELNFPLILDGATGTQIQKRGFDGGMAAEKWTLEHPEAMLEIQRDYVRNGSQVIYAPTFGANRIKLEERGLKGVVEEYNLRLAALARQAAEDKALVAGDLAPTGKFLYPLGNVTFEDLVEVYTEQAAALEKAGVDLFVIETTMTLAEARAAVLAVKSVSGKPVFVSFTCNEKGRTLTGTDVTAALVVMQGMGVDAFGLNCSTGPEEMLVQLRRLSEYAEVPLMAKPNAGIPQVVDGKPVYNCPPEQFAALAEEMALAGVCIFGGCCGTEREHIAALAEKAAKLTMKTPAPAHPDKLPCATEKLPFLLDAVEYGDVLECDDDLEDALFDAEEEDDAMIAIRITSAEQLDTFSEYQGMIGKPLCLLCEDAELLEQALRRYQGRAAYSGSLSDEALAPLVKKYGLVR